MVMDARAELATQLPDGEDFLATVDGPFARGLRLHPARGQPRGWGGLAPVPWAPQGRIHAADIDPATRLDYHTGLAYPQDAASQLPVELLAPRPGEVVVDACAAPGSKSSQIGLALGADGLLICCDASAPRRRVLGEVLGRQGVVAGLVTPMSVEALARTRPGCADAVLLDVPCSGHVARSPRQVAAQARRQAGILRAGAALLRPGGRLVYSTCTPYEAENEGVIGDFLAAHPEWTVEAATPSGVDPDLAGLGGCRLWPQRQASEPFFAIRLRAPGDGARRELSGQLPRAVATTYPAQVGELTTWQRGDLLLVGTPAVAACALPSEARGLILARGREQRLELWGAQWLISRGAPAVTVSHELACALWAGGTDGTVEPEVLLRSDAGAPVGLSDGSGGLRVPSRLRCRVV